MNSFREFLEMLSLSLDIARSKIREAQLQQTSEGKKMKKEEVEAMGQPVKLPVLFIPLYHFLAGDHSPFLASNSYEHYSEGETVIEYAPVRQFKVHRHIIQMDSKPLLEAKGTLS